MNQLPEDYLPVLLEAVEKSASSIVITDADGRILYVNPQFTRTTGYSREEAIGQNPRILKSGYTPPEKYRELWQTISGGQTWRGEFHNKRKDGSLFWETAVITPVRDANGRITHYLAVKDDVTQSRQTRRELEERNRQLEAVNQILQTIVTTLDLERILQLIADKIHELLKAPAASIWLIDRQTGSLVCRSAAGPYRELLVGRELPPGKGISGQAVARGQTINEPNLQNNPRYARGAENKAGVKMRSALFVPLPTVNGVSGLITLGSPEPERFREEDVVLAEAIAAAAGGAIEQARLHQQLRRQYKTEKEMKTRLAQAEKLAAIGELTAGITHELNNPLTAITLYSQLLERKTGDQKERSILQKIRAQAQRASRIVRRLLDFARQNPAEKQPVEINKLLQQTVELLSYELRVHNIRVETILDENLPLTLADPQQIQQVFVNLIINAAQAMDGANGGGALTLKTERRSNDQEDAICIMVQDDGPGISKQIQSRIFDPFFTTKPQGEGTGLGLAVCHGIVSQHGGYIWAESNKGNGTAFFVKLPVVPPEEAARPAPPSEEPADAPPGRPRILVIDDENSITDVLVRLLRRNGYAADGVLNGPDALERLAQKEYDLIICDLRMPEMGGGQVYEEATTRQPELADRFIFTTGDIAGRRTGLLPGNSYLQKPFDKETLLQAVRRHLQAADNQNQN